MQTAIQTYTGKMFNLFDFNDFDFDIKDIAHALSNICRYTGHTTYFYSVGLHSILASKLVSEDYKLVTLMHDATEAYLLDIPRPFKQSFYINGIPYTQMEERLWKVIARQHGLPSELPKAVKDADLQMLSIEYRDLMLHNNPDFWKNVPEPSEELFLNNILADMNNPRDVEEWFLDHYWRYKNAN